MDRLPTTLSCKVTSTARESIPGPQLHAPTAGEGLRMGGRSGHSRGHSDLAISQTWEGDGGHQGRSITAQKNNGKGNTQGIPE